ncbi:FAER362Wp [Eremothecium gossypii FDAG1]|nr:FAER362Wp [Eremothecium gossypii FDAG1]
MWCGARAMIAGVLRAGIARRVCVRLQHTLSYTGRTTLGQAEMAAFYPSVSSVPRPTASIAEFNNRYVGKLSNDEPERTYVINGQIRGIRVVGRSMCFVDLQQQGSALQLIVNHSLVRAQVGDKAAFQDAIAGLRPGDHVQATGFPGLSKTERTLSLKCREVPRMLAAAQIAIPPRLTDRVKRQQNRTLDYLVNGLKVLEFRHKALTALRAYLNRRGFLEVETPMLSAKSSGANATPFVTHLRGQDKQALELRIAPELWLKRLCVGGAQRVYEIGKVFRNEGIDATHNPEFTTLELYQCYAPLDELLELAQVLLRDICVAVDTPVSRQLLAEMAQNGGAFRRVEFLPTLSRETGVDWAAVDLADSTAIRVALSGAGIDVPESIVSPQQILNKLCADYIEDRYCQSLLPTAILHHPAVMSPLAKSAGLVANRFELFVCGRELINAYEEENCPQEQLKKMQLQQRHREQFHDQESMQIDHHYIEAMKYGMPPIGGLGLGIDRLCMLLLAKARIEEVLPFGCLDDVNRQ